MLLESIKKYTIKNYEKYEYFNTIENIDKEGDKYTSHIYTFKVENNTYYVSITIFDYNNKHFTVDFQIDKDFEQDNINKKDVLSRTYTNTNKFNSFIILSTVTKIIIDYYNENKNKLNEFSFVSYDDKRHNIYKTIIQKYFPEWVIISDKRKNDKYWKVEYQF